MTLILIIFCIWGASALVRAAKENKRRREEKARSEQIKRMQREYQRQRAEAAEWTRKQIEMEREQRRIAKEQERERRERIAADEKLAKEQEKLAKRVELLECKVRKLARDIESQKQLVADYSAQLDYLLLQQSGTTPGSKEFAKWQDKIVTKSNQVRRAENKYYDMMEAKAMAERELAA